MRKTTLTVLIIFAMTGTILFPTIGSASVRATAGSVAHGSTVRTSSTGYHKVIVFAGSSSVRTRAFTIRPNNEWLLQWRFNCRGVALPAFIASGFKGSRHDGAISIFRKGRIRAYARVKIEQTGTFHFRVHSDCAWRLAIYRETKPATFNPFSTQPMMTFLAGRHGDVTAAVYDTTSAKTFLYRPGISEQTASIVKVDILATLLYQEQQHSRSLDKDDMAIATGMIEDSDNDDATMLWDEDGGSAAVARFDSVIGLTNTVPNSEGFWGETTTSAIDQVDLLKHLVLANSTLDDSSRTYELGLMEHVAGYQDWGVSEGPASNAIVALKNGWLPLATNNWQINSIGYVNGDGRQYLVAMLTTGDPSENYGIGTIEGMSRIIWSQLSSSNR